LKQPFANSTLKSVPPQDSFSFSQLLRKIRIICGQAGFALRGDCLGAATTPKMLELQPRSRQAEQHDD
jgi:capsular polysaccharide biosynthesis protein